MSSRLKNHLKSWPLWLKKHPLFCLLLVILAIISIGIIKPGYYIMGWDNFSAYFNLKTNLFRTLFATWRDYRTLGVPSDSEVTDIFRQIFFLILSPILPEWALEQVYYVFSLNFGLIMMYVFALSLFKRVFTEEHWHRWQDTFAFVAAFFYLFNLNTTSNFYFPIIMFVNRFYGLPLLFYTFLRLFDREEARHKAKTALWAFFAFLGATGSYLTATVFVTVVMSLGIFSLFQVRIRTIIIVFVFFIAANAFWLGSFMNYTIQKSGIIRLAPTFIDANEVLLNKPQSFFTLEKQAILFPSFFETKFTKLSDGKDLFFHPLAERMDNAPYNLILLIFPVLYGLGSMVILWHFKKLKRLLWIPLLILLYLFMAMKEFSPLGFIYAFFNNLTPLFGVIFRFGDTKFHVFIAFSGSIAVAVAIVYTFQALQRFGKHLAWELGVIIILLITIPTAITYQEFFTGNLLGFFMYNRMPHAYAELADIINKDPEPARVAHVPFDKYGYWKSYTWGMFGSSFFNFMINKPFIDKTFEPGSLENGYLDKRLYDLQENFASVNDGQQRKRKAQQMYDVLKNTGTKYLIYDETVTAEIAARGVLYWGTLNLSGTQAMVKALEDLHLIQKVAEREIVPADYIDDYRNFYPQLGRLPPEVSGDKRQKIILYKLKDYEPRVAFISHADIVDPAFKNILETEAYPLPGRFLQAYDAGPYTIYPFQRKNNQIGTTDNTVAFQLQKPFSSDQTYRITVPNTNAISQAQQSHMLDMTVKKEQSKVVITVYYRYLPTIQNKVFTRKLEELTADLPENTDAEKNVMYLSDWYRLRGAFRADVRLRVGHTVLPLPFTIPEQETYFTSVMAHGPTVDVSLLEKYASSKLKPTDLKLTDNPNCFNDKLEDYGNEFTRTTTGVTVRSKNGTTCFQSDIKDLLDTQTNHIELQTSIQGNSEDVDDLYGSRFNATSKPLLKDIVTQLPKPISLRLCIKEESVDECVNPHELISVPTHKTTLIVPTYKQVSDLSEPQFLFALKNMVYQDMQVSFDKPVINLFEETGSTTLTMPKNDTIQEQMGFTKQDSLTVSFPFAQSSFAYSYNPAIDFFNTSNGPCDRQTGYRTFRVTKDGFISYFEKCSNLFFTSVPFFSTNYIIWKINYNLGSGKYPQYSIDDGFYTYKREYFSLYQGYPDVPGMKLFQEPEYFFKIRGGVEHEFQHLNLAQTYTYLEPRPEFTDIKKKEYTIKQDSENEALLKITSLDVIEVPNRWSTLSLVPKNSSVQFTMPTKSSFAQILPSLWQVTVRASQGKGEYLLLFNEGYDKQWGIYGSLLDVFFGFSKSTKHTICDGYASCYRFTNADLDLQPGQTKTIYLFYWPERLALVGWIVTLGVLLFVVFKILRFPIYVPKNYTELELGHKDFMRW